MASKIAANNLDARWLTHENNNSMKKISFLVALIIAGMACSNAPVEDTKQTTVAENMNTRAKMTSMSFYDFKVKDINGDEFDFASLKGKRVMIVNTASECGYTPQYQQLQELYENYGGKAFTIIGFPANNFGGQEPGSDTEIAAFCQKNYGVTFPMMSKISVKGDNEHPLYKWLTSKEMNGVADGNVRWNFHKFLVDEKGNWVKELTSGVSPLDDQVIAFASGN
jgi:glutathione peroxidase